MAQLQPGQRFNKLTILSYSGMKGGRSTYNVVCECGQRLEVNRQKLVGNIRKSCGCLRQFNPVTLYKEVYRRYQLQAAERNLKWELPEDRALQLFKRHCRYCGIGPDNIGRDGSRKHFIQYSGIDRIDPKQGYNPSNCVPCCINCNRAKSDMTLSEFSSWLDRAYQHHFRD